ncbi:MAG: MFS transporter [Dehalococcoidia bacterium]|nr:MFS transporter [Dehalococcoidia bacterium]
MSGAGRMRPRFFYGWYIVASSMAANAILSAAYFQGFSAFILPIESHFGWGRSAISAAASLRQVETGVLGPAVGLLVDRFSPRKLIVAGAVVCGVGLIGLGLVNSLATFFFFFLLISFGASAVGHGVTWPTLIARWFRRKRGLAIGLAVNGPLFAGPMVVANTALIAAFGWRPILIGYGVVVLIVVTALGLVARDRPEAYGMLPDGDAPHAVGGGSRGTPAQLRAAARSAETGLTLRQVLRSRAFWLLSFYLGAMFIVNSGFQLHQIPYFVNDRGFSAAAAAVTVVIVVFASGVGRTGTGWLLDKVGYRLVLTAVALTMALAFLYLQVAGIDSMLESLPFTFLFGVAFGATIPMRGALGALIFGNRSLGSVIGVLQGTSIAAGVVGPILMGAMFDALGDYTAAIWILEGVALAALLPVLLMEPLRTLQARMGGAEGP